MPGANSFFLVQGYDPNESGIQKLKIIKGQELSTDHQIVIGQVMADALKKTVADMSELSGVRYRKESIMLELLEGMMAVPLDFFLHL